MEDVKVLGLPAEKGRWLLVPLGIIILLCLGTAYSWTIFRTPIQETFQSNATDSLLPFMVLLIVFSILMPLTGFYIERFGPRRTIAVGAVIMGIGYVLSGLTSSIPGIIFTYGVIAGAGVGIVYGVPLAVVARWFPDQKGIAVGTTVIGFGLSPLITAPLANAMIQANSPEGWRATLMTLGIAFTIIMLVIALTMQYPPQGWRPSSWNPVVNTSALPPTRGLPMLETYAFWGLWICFIIGTSAGLAAIGIARQVAEEIVKLDSAGIAWNVSLFAIFNGLGRPLFGWVADRFTPRMAAIACYVLLIIASLIMLGTGEGAVTSYRFAFCLITLCFGGWLAIAPTSTLILFRSDDYAKNYGVVFTAFGMGALVGTLAAGRIRDLFGSYTNFFYVTAALAVVGIVIAVFSLKRSPSSAISSGLGAD
ncbi:MAG: OFA family MFS transporter [Synechococcales cyanobacterium M58_A2018_015]|nr:OFA family MFS transporter [Synechococcales cyanobacterium M58_A2018_015]